jgi:hypothetical protein
MNETYIDEKSGVEWSDVRVKDRPELIPFDVWRYYVSKQNETFLTVWIRSLADLDKLLKAWNDQQPGIWQYWY